MCRATALTLLLTAGLALASSAWAAYPGTNGSVVYTVPEGGPPALRRIESVYLGPDGFAVPDKADLRATGVDRGGDAFDPSWSADGHALAFASTRSGHKQIYAVKLDFARNLILFCGVEVCRLTNDSAEDYDPAWSPDGQQIVFTSTRDGSPQIYRMTASGGEVARLTFDNGTDQQATWSQSGRIAFVSNRTGAPEVYVMNANGGEVRQLTNQSGVSADPSWSPDGSEIAYANGLVGSFQVFVVKLAGGPPRRLTDSPADSKFPAWSPDGRKILVTQGPALSGETYLEVIEAKTGASLPGYLGFGGDGNWAPLPAPPSNATPSAPGITAIANPLGGRVTVNPGPPATSASATSASTLGGPVEAPVNSTYDTRQGTVGLAVASGGVSAPSVSTAVITGGRFALVQRRPSAVPTIRLLGRASGCARARATIARRRLAPHVRGHSKGRLKVEANAGRAASKGTRWEVRETCQGSLYRAFEDTLLVTDPHRTKPIRVTAGHHYLVRFGARHR